MMERLRVTLIGILLGFAISAAGEPVSPSYVAADSTSIVLNFHLWDSSDGDTPLTGITHDSASLEIRWMADNGSDWGDEYTVAGTDDVESCTVGSYAAPTAGKIRFCEVGNGLYQLQTENSTWSVTGATSIIWQVNDASDAHSILGTTFEVFTDVASVADINNEVDTALQDINLDHLLSAAGSDADVADDSIIAQLAVDDATADFTTYDNTTDSLEAQDLDLNSILSTASLIYSVQGGLIGQCDSGSSTTCVDATFGSYGDDSFNDGWALRFYSSPVVAEARCITDFDTTSGTFHFSALSATAASESFYLINDLGCATVPWNPAWDTEAQSEVADALAVFLEQNGRLDANMVNCEVNTANFPGSTTTLACILTDRDDMAITSATGDLEGRTVEILSGAQIYERRFINDTTWDAGNSELQITLSRPLPATLADAVTAIIH